MHSDDSLKGPDPEAKTIPSENKSFKIENKNKQKISAAVKCFSLALFYLSGAIFWALIKISGLFMLGITLVRSAVSFLVRKFGIFLIPSAIVAGISVFYVLQFLNAYTIGLNVYLDGEKVACVTSEENFENMVSAFESKLSYELGENYKIDVDALYEFTFVKFDELHDDLMLEEKLLERVSGDVKQMAMLMVEGEMIGANEDEEALRQMLESVKGQYLEGYQVETAEFEKDVEVVTKLCRGVNSTPIEEMEAYLTQPMQEEVKYEVVSGDTVWSIAPRYGMSTTELLNLNPQIGDGSKLSIGQEIKVSSEVPLISVNTYRLVEYEDTVDYEVETEYDASMYKNQKKVKIIGVKGTRWVKAEITLTNGVETDRRIIEETVLTKPVTQVEIVGTKALPKTAPTGTFARPASGTITATFGASGRRWSSKHTGIDIANAKGTAIYAADGGTVSFAGWKSSYGNTIIIDHGNGRQTLYGHLSTIGVSKGQAVAKGTKIAGMGSTGNASGTHLHFEIIINGTPRNPANYVNF